MKISQAGLELIKQEEGTVLYPYDDRPLPGVNRHLHFNRLTGRYENERGAPPNGYATIGTGHLIRAGEIFDEITMEQNDALLRQDLADVEAALNRQVPDAPGWNQHRYDAACDFGINCGALALTKYHVLEHILSGDLTATELHWKAINKSKGIVLPVLVRRRAREWGLYMTPMSEQPIEAAEILAGVNRWADRETEHFRAGNPLPDEEETPPTQPTGAPSKEVV